MAYWKIITVTILYYTFLAHSCCRSQNTTICDNNDEITLEANESIHYIESYNFPNNYDGSNGDCQVTIVTNEKYIKVKVERYLRRNSGTTLTIFNDTDEIVTSKSLEVGKTYFTTTKKLYMTHWSFGNTNDAFRIYYQGVKGECKSINCDSSEYRYKRCEVFENKNVSFIKITDKKSENDCTYGKSYGKDGSDIWVNKGCRATFTVCDVPCECKSVNCDSWEYRYKRCEVFENKNVSFIQVKNKKSDNDCTYGKSYGKDGGDIWVNKGCRATFTVCDVASQCDVADYENKNKKKEENNKYWIAAPVIGVIVFIICCSKHQKNRNPQPCQPSATPAPHTNQTSNETTGSAPDQYTRSTAVTAMEYTPAQGNTTATATECPSTEDNDRTYVTHRNDPPSYEEAVQFPEGKSRIVYTELQPASLPAPPSYSQVMNAINTDETMYSLQTSVSGVRTAEANLYTLDLDTNRMTPILNYTSQIPDETPYHSIPDGQVSGDTNVDSIVILDLDDFGDQTQA